MIIRPYPPWIDYYVDASVDDFLKALVEKKRMEKGKKK